MSKILEVDGLSKRYILHHRDKRREDTLARAIPAAARGFLRRLRNTEATGTSEEFWALRDISFTLEAGERLGVIGRNGAGKSTLLKVLSRITEPTRGSIRLRGRVASLLEIGTGFNGDLSGRENIYLSGAILGMRRNEIAARFDRIVDFAGVERFLDTPVKRYSSGMYMRLAFAVAAHVDPDILIVDEVLAVGDAEFQKKCLEKMGDVGREARTILFVSHSMQAIERLCTRALCLERGAVALDSTDVQRAIKHYMGDGGTSADILSRWTRTADDFDHPEFSPNSFEIVGESGQPITETVDFNTSLWCEIVANVKSIDSALTVGIAIYNEDGYCLFWSYQTDGDIQSWPRFHIGQNKMRVKIPVEILNSGLYRVELIGGLHFRQWFFEPSVNAPSVFFRIGDKVSSSPYWAQARPTLLAPKLQWLIT